VRDFSIAIGTVSDKCPRVSICPESGGDQDLVTAEIKRYPG
jgi:hypothetical protein